MELTPLECSQALAHQWQPQPHLWLLVVAGLSAKLAVRLVASPASLPAELSASLAARPVAKFAGNHVERLAKFAVRLAARPARSPVVAVAPLCSGAGALPSDFVVFKSVI